MGPRLLALADVQEQTSLSKTQIYRMIRRGHFPPQVVLGPRRVAWVEAEINRWLVSRVRARDGK